MSETDKIINAIKKDDLKSFIDNTKEGVDLRNANIQIEIRNTDVVNNNRVQDDQIFENGLTLLHVAAFYNALDIFYYIYTTRKVPLNILSVNSLLPLHYACWSGSHEIALYILTEDPAEASYIAQGTTIQLLYCSIMGGDSEILLSLLSNGASLSNPNNDVNRLLKKSIQLHKIDILQIIHDKTTDNQQPGTRLPNQAAKSIKEYNLPAFKTFYRGKQDIIFRDQDGRQDNLVRLICQNDMKKKFKIELLKILNEADDLDLNDPATGEGLVHYACEYLDLDVANKIIKMSNFQINKVDLKKNSGPFKLIGKKGQTAIDILRLLIDNGFAVNGGNPDSPSLLDAFAKSLYKNYEAIELLLQNDANMLAPCSIKRNNVNTIYEYVMSSKDDKMKKLFQKYHK